MAEKLNILVAIDEIPSPVWQSFACEANLIFVRDGREARRLLLERFFDIVLLDIFLIGIDGLQLLQLIQHKSPKPAVILTSEAPNFQFARQGLLYGACDYLLRPLTSDMLKVAFARIRQRSISSNPILTDLLQPIFHALGTKRLHACLQDGFNRISTLEPNPIQSAHNCRSLFQLLVQKTYQSYPWLVKYLDVKECETIPDMEINDPQLVQSSYIKLALNLNQLFAVLYPAQPDPQLAEIMQYMLTNVDRLFSQREVAQQFFLSASSLSERFSRYVQISYREYTQGLRLNRAAYLLRNTDLKLYEICGKLGFKDVSYFSRQFKQVTGQTVTSYRQGPYWDFQI